MFDSEATLGDLVARPLEGHDADSQEFQAKGHLQETQFQSTSETDIEAQEPYAEPASSAPKRLTLTFKNLTVRVAPTAEALGETLWSRVDPTQLLTPFRSRNTGTKRVRWHDHRGQSLR